MTARRFESLFEVLRTRKLSPIAKTDHHSAGAPHKAFTMVDFNAAIGPFSPETFSTRNRNTQRSSNSDVGSWRPHFYIFLGITVTVLVSMNVLFNRVGALRASTFLKAPDLACVSNANSSSPHLHSAVPVEEPPVRLANSYIPSIAEKYVFDHSRELGLHEEDKEKARLIQTCQLWKNRSLTPLVDSLDVYQAEIQLYSSLVSNFDPIPDLRQELRKGRPRDEVCRQVELHPQGLEGIFKSGQLSTGRFGKIEPLLPPLRHPAFCNTHDNLLNLAYLVHDFGAMCRRLSSRSRTVLVDMGASLLFHGAHDSPAVYITNLYKKFGIPFDHIYAFEISETKPDRVFSRLPEHLLPSYHWINVGVSPDPNNPMNPFKLLLNEFTEEDFVVVKLDIDTPAIEMPLVHQLLNDTQLHRIVDQFYFEHHVNLGDMLGWWGRLSQGSVDSSLKIFKGLREKGIAAHSWV